MFEFVQAIVIVIPFLVAAAILFARVRRGEVPNRMLLIGVGAMAIGAGFWFLYSNDPSVDLPWTWVVGLVLGLIALAATIRTLLGERLLIVTALLAPMVGLATLIWVDTVGPGVSDGAGGTYSFWTMLPIALVLPILFYSVPAIVTAQLTLHAARRPPVVPAVPAPR
jgi:hypothetical protein